MLKQQMDHSDNKFALSKEQKVEMYKPEQILMPVDTLFYSIKKEMTAFNTPGDFKAEKIKAEKVI